jgi:hypothetical protein
MVTECHAERKQNRQYFNKSCMYTTIHDHVLTWTRENWSNLPGTCMIVFVENVYNSIYLVLERLCCVLR